MVFPVVTSAPVKLCAPRLAAVITKSFAPVDGCFALDAHFFIKTRAMDELAQMLTKRRYVLVMSPRQSGKTTTAKYVARVIPGTIMLSFALYNSSKCIWQCLLQQLHSLDKTRFVNNPAGPCCCEDFLYAIQWGRQQGVHLIFDEVDVLLEHASDQALTEFLQTLRVLKQNERFGMHGVALLGTPPRLNKIRAPPRDNYFGRNYLFTSPPLSVEAVITPPRFEAVDVETPPTPEQ